MTYIEGILPGRVFLSFVTFVGALTELSQLMTNDEHAPREVAGRVPAEDVIVGVFFDVAGFSDDFEGTRIALFLRAGVAGLPVVEHA